jgi:hypothetical protein
VIPYSPNIDELVKSRNFIEFVIPAKAGIQLFQDVLDPGACPGHDPGFAGVTLQETFYEIINIPFFQYSIIPVFLHYGGFS